MHHEVLTDGWTLTAVAGPAPTELLGRPVPTRVPGTSHTALLDAGLIPDPYVERNETALAWMKRVGWAFERALDLAPAGDDERVDLVLDGVDTVATVSVGGHELGRTANQHRSYRFDVRALAGRGELPLRVDVASALAYAEGEAARLGARPSPYPQPYNMVRKMACSFGWDWGPDLQTAGLWKPVRVERWRVARLASVRPLVTVAADGDGRVEVHVELERSGLPSSGGPLLVRARAAGVEAEVVVAPDAGTAVVVLDVPAPALWWPVGYGEQALHGLEVELAADGSGAPVLDAWSRRIGFRTIEVDTSGDDHGTRFTMVVNGVPVFVKGANWIPDDHLLTRITRERLARRIDQAVDANLNLLRVWGGGIYESEDFYELCDARGVLVWQDFLLACAAYPEESPLWEEIEAEARENVVRLAPHPSLALWNGGNENLWGHEDWGWKAELDGRSWGERYALELLAGVVAELDPTRAYSPNSPSTPRRPAADVHPNDPDHGTHHEWEVWNRVDYAHYRDDVPRFCSEFGFQGPPTWATLTRAVGADADGLTKDDPTFLLHQKADDGNAKLDRGLAPHLGVPSDFVDWHWATQLNQARAVEHAIAHYRSWWPRTAGAIVWQLNDCWPVTSWAAVDGDERPKPLWYALRHAFADRVLTVVRRADRLAVAVVNDTDAPWVGALGLTRSWLDGTELAHESHDVVAAPRSVVVVLAGDAVALPDQTGAEALVARLGTVRTVHTWAEDVDLALDPAAVRATARRVDGGYEVIVAADSLVRDVALLVDRLAPDARVDDQLVTLFAGETATFRVTTDAALDPLALTRRPVLRSANDLRDRVQTPVGPAGGGGGRSSAGIAEDRA
ncbi:glycosyl hydrolase 2 galactose-binding domain-containing protein [Cellulomonas alba]|uniref:beta-mannosidase n=1 Tax=Cellulomonas alba TaxID=3053467 RepID=A0ABT7SEW5_9CELL|nr:glycoside hydrolase family 2 protein [Cellulomonas alba]MDM7854735.1 glycoside hydrolase family 2 protein [Cellulomonas alba]